MSSLTLFRFLALLLRPEALEVDPSWAVVDEDDDDPFAPGGGGCAASVVIVLLLAAPL